MTTKERILAASLRLFNAQGIQSVTTRHIAAEMKMSHGNLCYHFHSREAIMEQLYYDLVDELNEAISQAAKDGFGLPVLFNLTHRTFSIQYRYRFVLLHMVEIMRRIPSVGQHFRQLLILRKSQFGMMIEELVKQGMFQAEPHPGQYQRLITQFYLVGDFWISEAEILYEGPEDKKVSYYVQITHSLVIPYLTERGMEVYKELQASKEAD